VKVCFNCHPFKVEKLQCPFHHDTILFANKKLGISYGQTFQTGWGFSNNCQSLIGANNDLKPIYNCIQCNSKVQSDYIFYCSNIRCSVWFCNKCSKFVKQDVNQNKQQNCIFHKKTTLKLYYTENPDEKLKC